MMRLTMHNGIIYLFSISSMLDVRCSIGFFDPKGVGASSDRSKLAVWVCPFNSPVYDNWQLEAYIMRCSMLKELIRQTQALF